MRRADSATTGRPAQHCDVERDAKKEQPRGGGALAHLLYTVLSLNLDFTVASALSREDEGLARVMWVSDECFGTW